MINIIFASDLNGVIGLENKIPWNIPYDLRRFKSLTINQTVVMGRRTYESLPFFPKGFPKRNNVIVSKTLNSVPGCEVIDCLETYLKSVKTNEVVWVVGGADIYHQALPYADRIYHTEVHGRVNGDTYFTLPGEIMLDFKLLYSVKHLDDQEAEFPYTMKCYVRK